jgi:predicted phage tail protein
MKEVLLNGFIGDKYGKVWNIKANNIKDIFSCIECNYPSFRQDMLEFAESGGDIDIQFGDVTVEDEEELLYTVGADTVVITPLPAGAKSGGAKLLLAALIVASFFIPGSGALLATAVPGALGSTVTVTTAAGAVSAAGIGALNVSGLMLAAAATGLAMQGIAQMMAPDPSVDSGVAANDQYLFDGAQNTVAQNNAVPVLLGEMIVGGVMISSTTVSSNTSFFSMGPSGSGTGVFTLPYDGSPATDIGGGGGGGGSGSGGVDQNSITDPIDINVRELRIGGF